MIAAPLLFLLTPIHHRLRVRRGAGHNPRPNRRMVMDVVTPAPVTAKTGTRYRKSAWTILLLFAVVALAMVAIPVWLIMPFKTQTPRGLDLAFTLKRWSPLVTLIGGVTTVALTIYLWRGARWFKRTVLVLFVALASLLGWFARQNHFEWMFNPLPNASFAKASDAGFVADTDQVMAVEINDEAVAFPIRSMGYHHVIEDTIGGTPIVATY